MTTCKHCGIEITEWDHGWADAEGDSESLVYCTDQDKTHDGIRHQPEDDGEECGCDAGVLVHQSYGLTSPPWPEAVLVQRCDECAVFEGDVDAALAFAGRTPTGRVHAIGDGENLAPQSDPWVMPYDNPGPVVWHPTGDAVRAGWYIDGGDQ